MKHDLTLRSLFILAAGRWQQWSLLLLGLAVLSVWTLTNQTMPGNAAEPEQANLLRNGSFDNGSVGLALTAVPDWTITRGTVDVLPGSPSHPLGVWQHAADGQNSLDLIGTPGVGTIRQTFQTEPGRKYTFSGWVAHHYGTPEAGANVYVNGAQLSPLYHNQPNQQGDLKWQRFSREFTANSTSTTLTLATRCRRSARRLSLTGLTPMNTAITTAVAAMTTAGCTCKRCWKIWPVVCLRELPKSLWIWERQTTAREMPLLRHSIFPRCPVRDGRFATKTAQRPSATGWPIFLPRTLEFCTSRRITWLPATWKQMKWRPSTRKHVELPISPIVFPAAAALCLRWAKSKALQNPEPGFGSAHCFQALLSHRFRAIAESTRQLR